MPGTLYRGRDVGHEFTITFLWNDDTFHSAINFKDYVLYNLPKVSPYTAVLSTDNGQTKPGTSETSRQNILYSLTYKVIILVEHKKAKHVTLMALSVANKIRPTSIEEISVNVRIKSNERYKNAV